MNSDVILMKRILGRLDNIEKEIIALSKKVDAFESNLNPKSSQ